ncbi:hypothetical protein LCGC14_1850270 [marine sediment metagenome]|uniref:Uncharacterized protein n=1 Tax=marine sediment metagenome TaxID=412755 RepID=A0A0F9GAJ0_9ZZZZ|nr:hypothetical protein [Desulfobacterales bacterium]
MSNVTLKTPVLYEECVPEVCAQCRGSIFISGVKPGTLPPEHPKNPTSETVYLTFTCNYCKECGLERGKPARIVS